MPEKKKTLENHLVEKIKESGYPLEMEISALLDKMCVVFNTHFYFDEESKQGRDIDIYAFPNVNLELFTDEKLEEKVSPFGLRTEMVVECKKSETHVWVFYTRPFIPPSHIHISGQYRDDFTDTGVPLSLEYSLFEKLRLHYDSFERVAVAYDEIKVQGKGKSKKEIFEAVNQLIKCTCYEMGPPMEPSEPTDIFRIFLLLPIIVFDGDMFEVSFESGEPILKRQKHLVLNARYRSPYSKKVEEFLIDIVHHSYFNEFMKLLNEDFVKIRNAVIQKRDKLLEEVKKAWKKYENGKRKKVSPY